MSVLNDLWHRLTAPHAVNEDEARREYMTKVILLMMGVTLSVFTLLLVAGWFIGEFYLADVIRMLSISLPVFIGWGLAHASLKSQRSRRANRQNDRLSAGHRCPVDRE